MTITRSNILGPAEMALVLWRKSSYSGASGTCVEVAGLDDGYRAVRDSTDPAGPTLLVTAGQWAAFTAGIRAGEFG